MPPRAVAAIKRTAAIEWAAAMKCAAAMKRAAAMNPEAALVVALLILGMVVTTSLLFAVR